MESRARENHIMTNTNKVITNLEQVTPAWLTSVLMKSGAITDGAVESFELDSGEGNWSESGSLKVTYSRDAKGSLQTKLFLKMKLLHTNACLLAIRVKLWIWSI